QGDGALLRGGPHPRRQGAALEVHAGAHAGGRLPEPPGAPARGAPRAHRASHPGERRGAPRTSRGPRGPRSPPERGRRGDRWDAGDREGALSRFQAGLALLEGGSGDIELANLYQEMGRLAFRSGDNARAIEWAERALGQAATLAGSEFASVAEGDRAAAEVTA